MKFNTWLNKTGIFIKNVEYQKLMVDLIRFIGCVLWFRRFWVKIKGFDENTGKKIENVN